MFKLFRASFIQTSTLIGIFACSSLGMGCDESVVQEVEERSLQLGQMEEFELVSPDPNEPEIPLQEFVNKLREQDILPPQRSLYTESQLISALDEKYHLIRVGYPVRNSAELFSAINQELSPSDDEGSTSLWWKLCLEHYNPGDGWYKVCVDDKLKVSYHFTPDGC